MAPPIYFFGRTFQLSVLVGLLLAAAALVATYFAALPEAEVPVSATAEPAPVAIPERPMAHRFDGSVDLKRGDLVILDGPNMAIRKVAAAPREAVLLRRGDTLQGFYMGGEGKYVIISGKEGRIVPADEIRAVVPAALTAAAP